MLRNRRFRFYIKWRGKINVTRQPRGGTLEKDDSEKVKDEDEQHDSPNERLHGVEHATNHQAQGYEDALSTHRAQHSDSTETAKKP
mmetsp:Transcript_8797/g.16769  ORF Transcript_8797/g.16769 Transcript_8797/m.16769 type:complete len:86 (-) Transcript_8797:1219-1476(-)